MRGSQHHEAEAILSELDELHVDHVTADENHRIVDELFRSWLVNGALSVVDSDRLISLLYSLRDAYAQHIKKEEVSVFPWAAKNLSATDLRAVGLEMAQRRGLTLKKPDAAGSQCG